MEEQQQTRAMGRQKEEGGREEEQQNLLVSKQEPPKRGAFADELRAQMEQQQQQKANEREENNATFSTQGLLVQNRQKQQRAAAQSEALPAQLEEEEERKHAEERARERSKQPESMSSLLHQSDHLVPRKHQVPESPRQRQRQPLARVQSEPQHNVKSAQREMGPADARFGEALRKHVEQVRSQVPLQLMRGVCLAMVFCEIVGSCDVFRSRSVQYLRLCDAAGSCAMTRCFVFAA
eukprot:2605061-Rhodomonas_salina.1